MCKPHYRWVRAATLRWGDWVLVVRPKVFVEAQVLMNTGTMVRVRTFHRKNEFIFPHSHGVWKRV